MMSLSGAQIEGQLMEAAEITQPVCQMSREQEDPEEHKY